MGLNGCGVSQGTGVLGVRELWEEAGSPPTDGQDLHRDPRQQRAQRPLAWKEGRLGGSVPARCGGAWKCWMLATEGKLLPRRQTCHLKNTSGALVSNGSAGGWGIRGG